MSVMNSVLPAATVSRLIVVATLALVATKPVKDLTVWPGAALPALERKVLPCTGVVVCATEVLNGAVDVTAVQPAEPEVSATTRIRHWTQLDVSISQVWPAAGGLATPPASSVFEPSCRSADITTHRCAVPGTLGGSAVFSKAIWRPVVPEPRDTRPDSSLPLGTTESCPTWLSVSVFWAIIKYPQLPLGLGVNVLVAGPGQLNAGPLGQGLVQVAEADHAGGRALRGLEDAGGGHGHGLERGATVELGDPLVVVAGQAGAFGQAVVDRLHLLELGAPVPGLDLRLGVAAGEQGAVDVVGGRLVGVGDDLIPVVGQVGGVLLELLGQPVLDERVGDELREDGGHGPPQPNWCRYKKSCPAGRTLSSRPAAPDERLALDLALQILELRLQLHDALLRLDVGDGGGLLVFGLAGDGLADALQGLEPLDLAVPVGQLGGQPVDALPGLGQLFLDHAGGGRGFERYVRLAGLEVGGPAHGLDVHEPFHRLGGADFQVLPGHHVALDVLVPDLVVQDHVFLIFGGHKPWGKRRANGKGGPRRPRRPSPRRPGRTATGPRRRRPGARPT